MNEFQQMVSDNLLLVHYTLKKMGFHPNNQPRSSMEYEDLYQEGCLALCLAVINFDKDKGYKFSTFAIPYIAGAIKKYLRDKDRLISQSRDTSVVVECWERFCNKNGINQKELTDNRLRCIKKEIEEKLHHSISINTIKSILLSHNNELIMSIDFKIELSDNDTDLCEIIGFNDNELCLLETEDLQDNMIEYALSKIKSNRDRDLFEEYIYDLLYCDMKSKQKDIGKKYGVCQVTASRIINKGLKYCKKYLEEYV